MGNIYVMYDLETMGTGPSSPILQIGAVVKGWENNSFNEYLTYDKLEVDFATLQWWMQQDKEAQRIVFEDKSPIYRKQPVVALSDFSLYLQNIVDKAQDHDVYLISHGFDQRILFYWLDKYGMELPIHYRNVIDLRSYERQAEWLGMNIQVEDVGIKHDALSDAIYQARWLDQYLEKSGVYKKVK